MSIETLHEAAESLDTEIIFDEVHIAYRGYEKVLRESSDKMAKGIIEGGGITKDTRAFAFAMHGIDINQTLPGGQEKLFEVGEKPKKLIKFYHSLMEKFSKEVIGEPIAKMRSESPQGLGPNQVEEISFIASTTDENGYKVSPLTYEIDSDGVGRILLPVVNNHWWKHGDNLEVQDNSSVVLAFGRKSSYDPHTNLSIPADRLKVGWGEIYAAREMGQSYYQRNDDIFLGRLALAKESQPQAS